MENFPINFQPEYFDKWGNEDTTGLDVRIQIQERYRSNPKGWFDWLFDHLAVKNREQVLELGCGLGDLWKVNAKRVEKDLRITLTDTSYKMVRKAKEQLSSHFQEGYFAIVDSQSIPFPNGYFDAIIAIGLLDLVQDRSAALNEIRRVLKPGGKFYTSAGGHTHLQEIEAIVRPFLDQVDVGGNPDRFGLENGSRLLSPWFSRIERFEYPNQLVFDNPAPIAAYVLSEAEVRARLVGEKRREFIRFLQQIISAQGAVRVTVDKGLFIASSS